MVTEKSLSDTWPPDKTLMWGLLHCLVLYTTVQNTTVLYCTVLGSSPFPWFEDQPFAAPIVDRRCLTRGVFATVSFNERSFPFVFISELQKASSTSSAELVFSDFPQN